MDVAPVLRDDNGSDGDGDEDGQRRSHTHRDAECQQRNGDERLTETEGGTDECGGEDDDEDEEARGVDEEFSRYCIS